MLKKVKSARRGVAGDDTSKGWRSGKGSLGVSPGLLFEESGPISGACICSQKGLVWIEVRGVRGEEEELPGEGVPRAAGRGFGGGQTSAFQWTYECTAGG